MLAFDDVRIVLGGFAMRADAVFPAGGVTALMGASGSGKSTLLGAVAGFVEPAAGRITIDGADVAGRPPGDRPVSILFQDGNLFPHMTLAQNVGLGLRPDLWLSGPQAARRDDALAAVGLAGLGDRKPAALSGGQQGRAALARALLRRRPWLLLDEPFAALGPALRREMLDLVRASAGAEGLSVLMVTHDPGDARRIADRTALIADGAMGSPTATGELFADPPPALRAYLGEDGGR